MDMENTILKQIQQNLDALQKQIDGMKPTEAVLEIPDFHGLDLRDKLKEKSGELMQIMKEMIDGGDEKVFVSAVFSASSPEHGNLGESGFYFVDAIEKINNIDEAKLAGAAEAFSSPKRITILKALMSKKFFSSNELTMKTGCIGGQLYHHLSILENAKIICKSNDMYTLTDYGRTIINQFICMVFGERL